MHLSVCLAYRNFCLQLGLICVTKKEEEDFFFQLVNTEDGRAQEKKNRGEDSNAATHFRCSLHGARVSLASTGQLILQPNPRLRIVMQPKVRKMRCYLL